VRTEDHPLEYERFSGVIPKGEYGAGTMTIWDKGRVEFLNGSDGPETGEVKLKLYGRRLRGEWHLVKTQQGPDTWLLFKSKDRYSGVRRDSALGLDLGQARERPFPRSLKPMQPLEGGAPFTDPAWLFEAEFQGLRVQAAKSAERIVWQGTRARLPRIEQELSTIRAEAAWLDGLLVVLDEHQRPSRARLDERLAAGSEEDVAFYVFDLVHFEDFDLTPLATLERKAALRALLPPLSSVLFLDHVLGEGEKLAETVAAAGLEALLAKRADAPYTSGPSSDWKRIALERAGETAGVPVMKALARTKKARSRSKVQFSNLDKVYWPAEGYTKGDLLAYYETVADVLLPYLKDRPIHLNRFPDGISGKSFYQKDAKPGTPDWVSTVEIGSKHRKSSIRYIVCNDRDTLLYLVNLGSIDLHPWMSRVASQDSPDWAVIDLDPKDAPFTDVIKIAREVGKLLRGIGLAPLLKTSGSTGLHVFLGLEPGYSYQQAEMFCEGVARIVVRELPEIATVERAVGERGGKVYVDFGQNKKGQTVVPPYVVRPVRGATVSTPLEWDELERDLSLSRFTIQTLPERLARLGDLFRPVLTEPQDLGPAVLALESYLR
jgi:DNA ligase D-like protein (predicted polymerase)